MSHYKQGLALQLHSVKSHTVVLLKSYTLCKITQKSTKDKFYCKSESIRLPLIGILSSDLPMTAIAYITTEKFGLKFGIGQI